MSIKSMKLSSLDADRNQNFILLSIENYHRFNQILIKSSEWNFQNKVKKTGTLSEPQFQDIPILKQWEELYSDVKYKFQQSFILHKLFPIELPSISHPIQSDIELPKQKKSKNLWNANSESKSQSEEHHKRKNLMYLMLILNFQFQSMKNQFPLSETA
jgi:hypothetical protein